LDQATTGGDGVGDRTPGQVDYFISHNQADRAWAEWIAWELQSAGYTTLLQAWDFVPGADDAREMEEAVRSAKQIIAVMSPAYFSSRYGEGEWQAAFADDPTGTRRRLVPVRVAEVDPPGVLRTLPSIDLVHKDKAEARAALLQGIAETLARPAREPSFPGSVHESSQQEPRFPRHLPELAKGLEFALVMGDITVHEADVAVFKYAQSFHGADSYVANHLFAAGLDRTRLRPQAGEFDIASTRGALAAKQVLYVGVSSLSSFGYPQIRSFTSLAMRILAEQLPDASHVAMTLHGPNFGLDEIEAVLSMLAGCVEGFADYRPRNLRRISIVEQDQRRLERLVRDLPDALEAPSSGRYDVVWESPRELVIRLVPAVTRGSVEVVDVVGERSESKQPVFVAMPFGDKYSDLYEFGIYQPVRAAGYRCERVDNESFTGDVLDRVKVGIENAAYVVAVLTGQNPNVFLEVGYAWGKGIPTILVAGATEELPFDVRLQRTLVHGTIKELARKLGDELRALG
jgi:TIR domain